MPIETDIDETRRCVLVTASGDMTFSQMAETISAAVRDPRFRPGYRILSDHMKVITPIRDAQVEQVIQFLEELSDVMSGSRWAMVTTRSESAETLSRVANLARRVSLEMRVFATTEEAEAWLFHDEEQGG